MIKAISFDFYGVLYSNFDWQAINDRIYSDESKHKEFRGLVDAANQGVIGNDSFRMRVKALGEDQNHPETPTVHLDAIINTELMQYIKQIKANHDIKMAILSNGGRSHVCEILGEYDTLKEFDLIATSAELPNYKPEPEAFQYIATYFGVENNEVAHIDDSPRHIEGAVESGINPILYTDVASLKTELDALLSS